MAREIEIKLRVGDVAAFLRKLRRAGARTVPARAGRVHEWNTLYDTAAADLRGRDELLRIRVETPAGVAGSKGKSSKRGDAKVAKRFVLTFKGPVASAAKLSAGNGRDQRALSGNHKVREEIELEVGDSKALSTILAR